MRLMNLYLHNVGPFQNSSMELLSEEQVEAIKNGQIIPLPDIIITGENGTGKSVILDAIRTILSGIEKVERDIIANHDEFKISLDYVEGTNVKKIESTSFTSYHELGVETNDRRINLVISDKEEAEKVAWIVDYWSPDLDSDSFQISNLSVISPNNRMASPFLKTFKNADVNRFICFLDYLRGSNDKDEQKEGQYLYGLVSDMLSDCLVDGHFLYVGRKTMMPVVEVRGKKLSIDKLSMGNLLLFNHFISTLYRMSLVSIK